MSQLGQSIAARTFQAQLQHIALFVDGPTVFVSFCIFEWDSSIADGTKWIHTPVLKGESVSLGTGGESHGGLFTEKVATP